MNFIEFAKKSLFKSSKPKVEDYFVNPTYVKQRKGKFADGVCLSSCGQSFFCEGCGKVEGCFWVKKIPDFDSTKPSILLIDDNPGMVSFLRDDIEEIFEKHHININAYNILEFDTKFAAYNFIATHDYYNGLNIMYAIIDITYGGSVQSNYGNLRLTGVDIFREIYRINPDVKFVFYTGNQLNPYIKSNKELMDSFTEIYHDNIMDYVLYKTSLDMDDRRDYFAEKLFDIRKEK